MKRFQQNMKQSLKQSHQRARKAIGSIKNLVTEYRKASVAEDK